jgi:drug/metabolite transporter (DMT)-like permease
MNQLNSHQRGLLMTAFGVLVLTPDALLLRLIETDHWTLVFWRSFFMACTLLIFNAIVEKRGPHKANTDLFRGGMNGGWFCALLFAGSNICFVLSITHTAVANTLVILASMPFIAALLTVFLMRKGLPFRTWATIVLAMAGIVMVFWGRFGDGNSFGDAMAALCAMFMAGTLVSIAHNPKINSLAAIGLASLIGALFALFMGAEPGLPSRSDFAYLVLNGAIVLPIAMGLITYGPKLISAPEVSLILLLETVLGPLWVWLALGEAPPGQTFAGGGLVVAAILVNAWLGFREQRN